MKIRRWPVVGRDDEYPQIEPDDLRELTREAEEAVRRSLAEYEAEHERAYRRIRDRRAADGINRRPVSETPA